ncbi:MAG: hypothetical protein GXP27_02455 [Planctomycetes bacterium]|nr:hypothetical protein [Planctomycetota bacterium]
MSGANRKLLVVLGCALLLRLVAAVGVQAYLDRQPGKQFLIEGDAWGYWELGRKLAHGKPFEIHHPPRRVHRMPGFPMVLAGCIRVFGENLLATRLVLAVVGTGACWMVYLLGKELCDPATGLLAAALAAIIPHFVGFSVLVLTETTFAGLLVLSLWCMARLVRRAARGGPAVPTCLSRDALGSRDNGQHPSRVAVCACLWALATGAAVALATYARPSWLLAGPAFALGIVWAGRAQRTAWMTAAMLLLGVFAALLPWIVRNWRVTGGRVVVTTLWLGPSLYDGLNPEATGESDMTFFDRDNLMSRMSEYEVNRYYTQKALEFAVKHPGRTLKLAAVKLGRFWKPWPNAEQFRQSLRLAVLAFFVTLVVLAVVGGWRCRHSPWTLLLTAGPIAYFSLLHMVFVGSLRYRLPAEYPLCVLAAVGFRAWWRSGKPCAGGDVFDATPCPDTPPP